MLTEAVLKQFCPASLKFSAGILEGVQLYEFNDPLVLAHFLAQMAHESGGFIWTRELWGPTAQQAKYEPPSSVAASLGNTDAGDGSKFRGRGLIQITGRSNYHRYSWARFGDDRLLADPTPLLQPEEAAISAAWFFSTHGCYLPASKDDIEGVTRRVNGGLNGLEERKAYLVKSKAALGIA